MEAWRNYVAKWLGPKSPAAETAEVGHPSPDLAVAEDAPEDIVDRVASPLAGWEDPIDLGSGPNDPLILDLVTSNPSSARLRNAVIAAHGQGNLPFKRVSDYIAAGRSANERMMADIANFGRKSAEELDRLVARVAFGQSEEPAIDGAQLRSELISRFEGIPLGEVLYADDPPVRLLTGLKNLGLADAQLSTVLLEFGLLTGRLLRLPNMGRTSNGV